MIYQFRKMSNKPDIIWVSTQDWDDVWTRKQRFAQFFARSGHRVFYIESQLHWPGYLRKKSLRRADRPFRFLKRPRQVEPNLYIVTPPLFLPGQMMSRAINRINKYLLVSQILRLVKKYHFHNPVLWLYPPDSVELVGKFNESVVIFDCVDDWSRFKGLVSQKKVEGYMNYLFRKSDLVFVTHNNLYNKACNLAKNVHLVPNGVDPEHFEKALRLETEIPDDIMGLPRPIIGFIGNVVYWLDFELIHYLASKRPSWSFVLVGPLASRADVAILRRLLNVHFLGYRPYAELPRYLKAFDACINPFKLDDLSSSIDPLKVYEYLAAGKPVVSVDMPAMSRFGDLVSTALDRDSFLSALDMAVASTSNKKMTEKRIMHARTHSWSKRFEQVNAALLNIISYKRDHNNPA